MKLYQKYINTIFIMFSVLLLCAGCGKTSDSSGTQAQGDMMNTQGSLLTATQWQNGFQATASVTATETPYYELRRGGIQSPDLDFSAQEKKAVSSYAWNGRYVLTSARGQEGERYFLSCQKSDLEWEKPVEILTDWQDRPHGYAACVDVVNEDRIAVLYVEKSSVWSGDVLGYDLLMLNARGEVQSILSVSETYGELGIAEDMLGLGYWWCDGEGYQYLLLEKRRLVVIDPQGQFKLEKTCDVEEEERFNAGFHMPDGSMVFSKGSSTGGGTKLLWTEFPAGTEHILWEHQGMILKQFTVTPEGVLYYTKGDSLCAWNLQTGQETMLYSFMGTDIFPNSDLTGQSCYVTVKGENELILYDLETGKASVFSDTPPENEENIVCGMLYRSSNHITACASVFSHDYGGKMIRCNYYSGAPADRWMRLSAELAAGNGPDLMVMTWEEMMVLQKIGALAPLDDLLTEKTKEAMFSGLRKAGTVDGKLYGVASEQAISVLITSDALWPEDSWTIRDILDIYDRGEMQGIIYGYNKPQHILEILIGGTTGDIPFYDTDRGESHFESEEFIRLLEICKQYWNTAGVTRDEAMNLLAEGKYLAASEWYPGINSYVNSRPLYGEGFHYVGFPEQKDGIGVYNSTNFIAVNQKAEDREEIGAFLNYLLSDSAQAKVGMGYATRSVFENKELFWYSQYDGDVHCMYKDSEGMTGELPMKADGTSYIPDYLELVDHAGIEIYHDSDVVWTIVEEETENFWNGTKSAEEVARTIDNRVQLYLDEQ